MKVLFVEENKKAQVVFDFQVNKIMKKKKNKCRRIYYISGFGHIIPSNDIWPCFRSSI